LGHNFFLVGQSLYEPFRGTFWGGQDFFDPLNCFERSGTLIVIFFSTRDRVKIIDIRAGFVLLMVDGGSGECCGGFKVGDRGATLLGALKSLILSSH
jgi:hypothetical protein